jgi:nitrogen fixation protein FixH
MVLACLVAFFAVVAAMNAILTWLALSTFGGVETANAYQAGLAFPGEIAAVEAQDALRWQVTGRVAAEGTGTLVEVTVRDRDARPLAGLDAGVRLVHPTNRGADLVVPLEERSPGSFRGRPRR